ncbi:hypothetical protein [Bradyrhizobium sp. CER78]|uniref:hypothetical protein n=1 Tax=Bradyrhizobium sp. CER78 TaxID=3039162 RepID=UPI0024482977|nr:hypothetical protein [Bradyrhizobium sp. CER78]MDH2382079.1 hypothetical protein [Bradyrhizobium sp. CER78]
MEVFVFRFTAGDLRKIERQALGFLVASSHCCNELVSLMPYIVFEQSLESTNDVESALILARRYTIDRIIVSKIVEYHDLCQKFFRQDMMSDEFHRDLKKEYEQIATSLKAGDWARIQRNTMSFHYDAKFAAESLDKLDGSHPLRMILGRMSGVTLFEFSEEILSRPIFERARRGDIGEGMDAVARFIVRSIRAIRNFHSRAMITAFTKVQPCFGA